MRKGREGKGREGRREGGNRAVGLTHSNIKEISPVHVVSLANHLCIHTAEYSR